MRPVNKPSSNSLYAPPASITFARANAQLLRKMTGAVPPVGNYTVSLAQVLRWLLGIARGRRFTRLTAAEQKTLVAALEGRIATIYKTAAAPLVQDLGAYCSYCGSDLPAQVEVEHTVPKSLYPLFSTDWRGFLLSCSPCNKAKRQSPARADVIQWSKLKRPTERDLYDEIRRRYLWPDLDPTCWEDAPAHLFYLDVATNQWLPVSVADSVDFANKFLVYDVPNHRVLADIKHGNAILQNVQVAVRVEAVLLKPWVDDMIDLLQLNEDLVNPAKATYDRRQMNRTRAWFNALDACRQLSIATDQKTFDFLWQPIPGWAAGSAFYSVWLTVLQHFRDPSGVNYASRLVADTNVPLYYPNTETAHLP
ncbi:calcium-binding protein [Pseudomonas japonica]|uniref:HNH endonuclease n=1 Tax=Pseudomonas japonica TaxID=256466 RepID=A0A239JEG0_9PSED|nr:calcium-binding protein [Pseudomonas japonica]SNT04210.1 hypothetical protein SAMN05444352_12210 [Pseudomonas japonica]